MARFDEARPRDEGDRHQEAEISRGYRAETDPEPRGDRRAGARDARQRSKRLRQPDDEGAPRRRPRCPFRAPMPREPQQRAGDEEPDSCRPQRIERASDQVLEEDSDEARRDHADDEQSRVAQRVGLASQHVDHQTPETAAVHDEDRSERRDMQRDFYEHAGRVHTRHMSDHGEMSVARDGKELGEPLHQPEQDALPKSHATFPATSATRPITMAPLSRALTRSTLPSRSQVAAMSIASWANSAITKYAPLNPAPRGNSRLAGTNSSPAPAAITKAGRRPTTIGSVRRPIVRSPGSSSTSLTISRTKCSHAASTHGTIPAAGTPTATAP